jgi:transposase
MIHFAWRSVQVRLALLGLTPKKYQSGEKYVTGGITRIGDQMASTTFQ